MIDILATSAANGVKAPGVTTADETGRDLEQQRPILMFGCHRNSHDSKFRDFALTGSKMDEFAWWGRKLQVNRTHNEVSAKMRAVNTLELL